MFLLSFHPLVYLFVQLPHSCVGSEVLTAVVMKVVAFWDITPSHLLARCFPAWLIFGLEHGGDTFLRNVGSYTDYTTLYLRRWQLPHS
jgi:hypothetical protein